MEQISAAGGMSTVVHLIKNEGGVWRIACMPHMKELNATASGKSLYMRSDDLRAVTCSACLKSQGVMNVKK